MQPPLLPSHPEVGHAPKVLFRGTAASTRAVQAALSTQASRLPSSDSTCSARLMAVRGCSEACSTPSTVRRMMCSTMRSRFVPAAIDTRITASQRVQPWQTSPPCACAFRHGKLQCSRMFACALLVKACRALNVLLSHKRVRSSFARAHVVSGGPCSVLAL